MNNEHSWGGLAFAFSVFPLYNCILCGGYLFWGKYGPEYFHVLKVALFSFMYLKARFCIMCFITQIK